MFLCLSLLFFILRALIYLLACYIISLSPFIIMFMIPFANENFIIAFIFILFIHSFTLFYYETPYLSIIHSF